MAKARGVGQVGAFLAWFYLHLVFIIQYVNIEMKPKH